MQNPTQKMTTRMKRSTVPLLRREQGSVLLVIIIVLIIFSALGAAMLPLTSTSNMTMVHANLYQTAYYLAESGYRYAASKFLHAGDGLTGTASADARDNMINTLNNINAAAPFAVDSNSRFYLNINAYYFNSVNVSGSNLITNVYGSAPPIASQAGYLLIGDTNYKYHYNSITMTAATARFNTIQDWTNPASPTALASTPGNERVFPVCQSTNNPLTATGVSCAAGTGIGIFPPKNGSFKINNTGHIYSYQTLDSANNQLLGISSPSGGPLPVTLTTSDFLVMQRFITLTSIGSTGGSIDPVTHGITYYLANVSTGTSGGGGSTVPPVSDLLPPDDFNNMDNWLPNNDDLVHGEGAVDASKPVPGGGTALMITKMSGSDHFVLPASSVISNTLKDLWSWENGLSYDAQVKIVVDSNISYAGGLYFRRHEASGGTNTSFGVSMVYLKDYNDKSVDVYADTLLNRSSADRDSNSCYDRKNATYCLLAVETPYLVLWKDTAAGPSGFKTIAYYQLPANYPAISPYWPTLLVRIIEKPSAPSYCGALAGTRVNEIQIYYSTNATGTGDTTPTNTTRAGNLRGAVNWPPDTGGTSAANDYFTLVSWNGAGTGTGPGWSNGSYQFGNPGDGANTVICTTDHLTNISAYGDSNGPATDFPPEVALAALGNNVQQHTWFDDFAIGSGTNNGSGVGSLTPGFQVPIQE